MLNYKPDVCIYSRRIDGKGWHVGGVCIHSIPGFFAMLSLFLFLELFCPMIWNKSVIWMFSPSLIWCKSIRDWLSRSTCRNRNSGIYTAWGQRGIESRVDVHGEHSTSANVAVQFLLMNPETYPKWTSVWPRILVRNWPRSLFACFCVKLHPGEPTGCQKQILLCHTCPDSWSFGGLFIMQQRRCAISGCAKSASGIFVLFLICHLPFAKWKN